MFMAVLMLAFMDTILINLDMLILRYFFTDEFKTTIVTLYRNYLLDIDKKQPGAIRKLTPFRLFPSPGDECDVKISFSNSFLLYNFRSCAIIDA
jgi:hypothetical protein